MNPADTKVGLGPAKSLLQYDPFSKGNKIDRSGGLPEIKEKHNV
jgi:hypothetical protein